jgi:UDP:flavonoid glycosyltransferase YjiC (YdhE family)
MKALIAPCGTYGDTVAPFALALKLRELGFELRIASSENFRPLFESQGLEFHSVGLDFQKELRANGDAQGSEAHARFTSWGRLIGRELEMQARLLPDLAADADIIIGSGLLFMGPSIAELHRKPYIQICHVPTAIPSSSAEYAPFVIKYRRRPRWANRALWALSRLATSCSFIPLLNRNRRTIGLPPIEDYGDYFSDRIILAADKVLAPPEPDGASGYIRTGYWQAPHSQGLPEPLQSFIEAGEKPIYVGFGSMAETTNGELGRALAILVAAGKRLILGGELAMIASGYDPAFVYPAAHVDHQLLFPHLALAVHHGGAGTTYTAAKAGIPQIVVPHLMDQFYWAARLEAMGIGKRSRHPSKLRARKLASTILEVASDKSFAQRARDVAERMEDGGAALD